MKKALSLILALVLCLSLCACGEKDTTSNEDVLKKAVAIDLNAIGMAFENNKVNAQDTYYNKYYTIVGSVSKIESDEVIINPISAVFGQKFSAASRCNVKLPIDEIKKLSTSDVIKVCGKLTDFTNGYDHYVLTLDEAFYVDNIIETTAKVNGINNYFGGKKSIVLKQTVQNGAFLGSVFYEIVIAKSGAENSEEAEYQGVIYRTGDNVTFTGVLKNNANRGSNYYDVVSVSSISKN